MVNQSRHLSKYFWIQLLARRAFSVVVDCCAAIVLGFLLSLLIAMMGLGTASFPAMVLVFILERGFGISMGNQVTKLAVINTSMGKNFIRALALLLPVFNLLDWAYALRAPEHRTFVDEQLGVKVLDSAGIW